MKWFIQRSALVAAFLPGTQPAADTYDGPEHFDFTHIQLAIRYFQKPSATLLNEIANSNAANHLERHSNRTGYYPADASAEDITGDLLEKHPTPATLQAVRNLLSYAMQDTGRQRGCMVTAASYLPKIAQPANPLHVTWGYDIGVAMDDHASLNFAHPHFLQDHQEIWFYCIHEIHHSGVMQLHPMPRIADIDTVRELYDLARYATFLEGLAVHSARVTRRKAGALGGDGDYVALTNPSRLDRILTRYEDRLTFLRSEFDRPLADEHWQVIEDMSSGERLWYVAGAAMAEAIERDRGRTGLLHVTVLGPEAFFDAYDQSQVRTRSVDFEPN